MLTALIKLRQQLVDELRREDDEHKVKVYERCVRFILQELEEYEEKHIKTATSAGTGADGVRLLKRV